MATSNSKPYPSAGGRPRPLLRARVAEIDIGPIQGTVAEDIREDGDDLRAEAAGGAVRPDQPDAKRAGPPRVSGRAATTPPIRPDHARSLGSRRWGSNPLSRAVPITAAITSPHGDLHRAAAVDSRGHQVGRAAGRRSRSRRCGYPLGRISQMPKPACTKARHSRSQPAPRAAPFSAIRTPITMNTTVSLIRGA